MMTWLLTNSLWLIGLGLMLASSGLDGAYMAAWMPGGWEWLGYVLNTTADVSGMVLMYFFGRLQQDKTKAKRKLSVFLLASEAVTAGYSWFFGWRQLLRVLPPVEPLDYQWIAPVAAGFIPALLAFIGYAESLLAGRFEASTPATPDKLPAIAPQQNAQPVQLLQPEPQQIALSEATEDTATAIKRYYGSNPLASQAQAAQAVGVSRQRVGALLTRMVAEGEIKRNGHGVEILA